MNRESPVSKNPRCAATDLASEFCSSSMLRSRAADFCRRSPASRSRACPSPVTKNNAARKEMIRNEGMATYQRPKPSNASLKKFTRIILFTESVSIVRLSLQDLLQCPCEAWRHVTCGAARGGGNKGENCGAFRYLAVPGARGPRCKVYRSRMFSG